MVYSAHPDVVLLDLIMPEMDGIEATEEIKKVASHTKVLILTSYEEREYLEKALQAGADGYLSKEVTSEELGNAIEGVLDGEQVFSRAILELLHGEQAATGNAASNPSVLLTKREQEILQLVAQGMTSQEIGEVLFISHRTVETHRANLMEKLGVRKAAGLVHFAMMNTTYTSRTLAEMRTNEGSRK